MNNISSRQSGKTTKMMERAVELLYEMPDNCFIFITGAHSEWLFELERKFKEAGLVNVMFFTPSQIIEGKLRGRRGDLLIDDVMDLSGKERIALWKEQRILREHSLIKR